VFFAASFNNLSRNWEKYQVNVIGTFCTKGTRRNFIAALLNQIVRIRQLE
jgi:hypothetical protein